MTVGKLGNKAALSSYSDETLSKNTSSVVKNVQNAINKS